MCKIFMLGLAILLLFGCTSVRTSNKTCLKSLSAQIIKVGSFSLAGCDKKLSKIASKSLK